jgi:hypothetical protein
MKHEEKFGFDTALDVDNEVWKILPKIQVRTLRSLADIGFKGMTALRESLEMKLSLEGFSFDITEIDNEGGFEIYLHDCPWHTLMVKSGREHLSHRVGNVICRTEYKVWASEFGDNIHCEIKSQICAGCESCVLKFSHVNSTEHQTNT